MSSGNGDKSKIIMFLVGMLQIIVLGWCSWIGSGVVEAKTDIATLQANYQSIMRELGDIKDLVKKK